MKTRSNLHPIAKAFISSVFFLLMGVVQTFAQSDTWTSAASGNWDAPATWTLNSGTGVQTFPIAGDVVTINGGFNVTVDVTSACASLTIGSTSAGTLTLTTLSLTVSGTVTNTAALGTITWGASGTGILSCATYSGTGILTVGNGTVSFTGSQTLTSANAFYNLDINGGTVTCSASFPTVSHNFTITGGIFIQSFSTASLLKGTTSTNYTGGTYTIGSGGSNTATIAASTAFGSLTINTSGAMTVSGGFSCTGTLTLTKTATSPGLSPAGTVTCVNISLASSTFLAMTTHNLTVNGTWTNAGTVTIGAATLALAGSTVTFGGGTFTPAGTTITCSGTVAFNYASNFGPFNVTAGTTTAGANISCSNINVAGTLAMGGNNLTVSGTWTNTGTISIDAATLTLSGSPTFSGGTFTPTTNTTISCSGTVAYNYTIATVLAALNVTAGTTTAGAAILCGNINVAGTLSLSTHNLTVSGTWTNSGTVTIGAATLALSGSSVTFQFGTFTPTTSTTITCSGTVALNYPIAIVLGALNVTAGTTTVGSNISCSNLNVAGTLAMSTHNLTVTGTWTNTGTVSITSGTLTLSGSPNFSGGTFSPTTNTTISCSGTVAFNYAATFGPFNVTAGITTAGANISCSNINVAGTLAMSTFTLTVSGTWTNAGTVDIGTNAATLTMTGTATVSGGTLTTSSANTTININSPANVTFSQTVWSCNNITVAPSATLTATVAPTVGSAFNVNGTYVLAYNVSSWPALTLGAASIIAIGNGGATTATIPASTAFANLTFNTTGTVTFSGGFSCSATLTLTLTAASPGLSPAGAVSCLNISLASGTFLTMGANNLTLSGAWTNAGTVSIDAATLTLSGSPTFSGGTFTPTSNTSITCSGTIAFNYAATFGPFNINTGTTTAGAAISCTNMNVASTLAMGSQNLTVSGTWTNTGIISITSGTLTLSGSTAFSGGTFTPTTSTTITCSGTVAYNYTIATVLSALNVTVGTTTAGAAILCGNMNVAGTLIMGTNNLTVSNTWTNTGTVTIGAATLTLSSGTVGGGTFTPTTATTITCGNITFNYAATFGAFNITAGTTTMGANISCTNINVAGTLAMSTHNLTVSGTWTNTGTVSITSGTLALSGSSVTFGGGTFTPSTSTTITCSGTVAFNYASTVGTFNVTGGAMTLDANVTASTATTITTGTLTINTPNILTESGTLTLTSGTITGTGTVVVKGTTSGIGTSVSGLTTFEYDGGSTGTPQLVAAVTSGYGGLTIGDGTTSVFARSAAAPSFSGTLTVQNNAMLILDYAITTFPTWTLISGSTIKIGGSTGTNTASRAVTFPAAGITFSNLTLATSGAITESGAITCDNLNIITGSSALAMTTHNLTVNGTWTNAGTVTIGAATLALAGSSVTFSGGTFTPSTSTTISCLGTIAYSYTIATVLAALNVPAGTTTAHAAILCTNLNVAGTLDMFGSNLTVSGTWTNTGTVSWEGTATLALSGSNMTVGGGTFTPGPLSINCSGNNIAFNYGGGTFSINNFIVSAGTTTMGGGAITCTSINVAGTLIIGNNNLTTSGSWTNTGSVSIDNGTLTLLGIATFGGGTFTPTTNTTITCQASTIAYHYNIPIVIAALNVNSGTTTAGAGDTILCTNLTVNGSTLIAGAYISCTNINVSGGTLTMGSNNLSVGGTWTNNSGTVTINFATLTLSGTATFSGGTFTPTSNTTITSSGTVAYNYVIDTVLAALNVPAGTTTAGAYILCTNINVGGTLAMGTHNLTVSGTWTNTGTVTIGAATLAMSGSSVTFGGGTFTPTTGTIITCSGTVIDFQYTGKTISTLNVTAGATTLDAAVLTSTTVTISSGATLAVTGSASGSATLNVSTTLTNSGTLNVSGNSSTHLGDVVFSGTSGYSQGWLAPGSSTIGSFGLVDFTGTSYTVASGFTVNSGGELRLEGAGSINWPGGGPNVATVNSGGMVTNSGTAVETTGNTIGMSYSGGTLNIATNNTTDSIKTTSLLWPATNTPTNVIINCPSTNAIVVLKSGVNRTISGTLTLIAGKMGNSAALSRGVLTMGNGATITRDAGSLSGTPAFTTSVNVIYNGASTTTTTGAEIPVTASVLNNLTLGKNAASSTVTLAANVTVNGTLTFTAGILITTGSFSAIIPSANATAISGASETTGWVDGTMEKDFPVSATSNNYKFEIGDATIYAPATVTLGSVTTSVAVTKCSTTTTDPSGGASSGMDQSHRTDHYWITSKTGGTIGGTSTIKFDATNTTNSGTAGGAISGYYYNEYVPSVWGTPAAGTIIGMTFTTGSLTNTSFAGAFEIGLCTAPSSFNVTGGGSYCSGGAGIDIGLSGSVSGVSYQLYIGSTTPVGSSVSGTGFALDFGNQATAGTYTVVATNNVSSCAGGMSGSAVVTVNNCTFAFTVKFFLQGYYIGGGKMSPLLKLLGVSANATDVDTVTIVLRNSSSPYAPIDSSKGILQSNDSLSCTFAGSSSGSYYIVIKHRNSLETWSNGAQTISSSASYDFTTGAAQAYGSNMANLGGGKYGIYSGDINQDGNINSSDKSSLQSALSSFLVGVYNANDLTGDGFVDDEDYRIMQDNIPLSVTVQHP